MNRYDRSFNIVDDYLAFGNSITSQFIGIQLYAFILLFVRDRQICFVSIKLASSSIWPY